MKMSRLVSKLLTGPSSNCRRLQKTNDWEDLAMPYCAYIHWTKHQLRITVNTHKLEAYICERERKNLSKTIVATLERLSN